MFILRRAPGYCPNLALAGSEKLLRRRRACGHSPHLCCFTAPFYVYVSYVFWSEVNIWNINCARATAFIFDTRTDVLVKVWKFLRKKMSRPEGDSNPQPSDSCECSNHFNYQSQTFAVHVFEYWLWQCRYFEVKLTFEMLTVRGKQHAFSTHERMFLWKCLCLLCICNIYIYICLLDFSVIVHMFYFLSCITLLRFSVVCFTYDFTSSEIIRSHLILSNVNSDNHV